MTKQAMCITFGEQSENHAGMKMYGNGLSERGYSITELEKFAKKYEDIGGKSELIRLDENIERVDPAGVLILRGGIDKIMSVEGYHFGSCDIYKELLELKWDDKYWDTRRSKVLNKRARWNVCFGEKGNAPDYENKMGRVIGYN